MTPEKELYEASMNRRCLLCGEPMRKHVVPAYGTPLRERTESRLWCPNDARITPTYKDKQ